jgi:flagellar protein FlaG
MGSISSIDSTPKVEVKLRPLLAERSHKSSASATSSIPGISDSSGTKAPETDAVEKSASQQPPQEEAIQRLRASLDQLSTRFTDVTIVMDDRYNGVVVKVVRRDSGEVVRQIPSEEFLNLHSKLGDARGILMSKKA